MIKTDPYVIVILLLALLALTGFAIFKTFWDWRRQRKGYSSAQVIRGDRSMSAIYTVYGASIASCLVLINNTESFEGNKVIIIALQFACLTYLFFFNSWFRNGVFFPIKNIVGRD